MPCFLTMSSVSKVHGTLALHINVYFKVTFPLLTAESTGCQQFSYPSSLVGPHPVSAGAVPSACPLAPDSSSAQPHSVPATPESPPLKQTDGQQWRPTALSRQCPQHTQVNVLYNSPVVVHDVTTLTPHLGAMNV